LSILAGQLNEIHNEKNSLRYWRIVIGVWLKRFIEVVYDRYSVIETAFSKHNINNTHILSLDIDDVIPRDMHDFGFLHANDEWNHFIFSFLIKRKKCHIVNIPYGKKVEHIKTISNTIKRASARFNRFNKVCFFASYIERKSLFKLQLSLGQVPAFDYLDRVSFSAKCNQDLRNKINFTLESINDFEVCLQSLIKLQIPYSYIESYKKIKHGALDKFSKNPELIITANGYSSFDDFKIWTATNIDKGAKLVVAQHGGHYGTGLFASNEKHEIDIADNYFSWGWQYANNKIKPMPALKLLRKITHNPDGDILVPLMSLPRYSYMLLSMPISGQIINYIQDQQDFLSLLSIDVEKFIKLRVYKSHNKWNIKERLESAGLGSKIDSPTNLQKTFIQRLSECRLCIATYNATTYLETFANNYPTLLFWDPKYWELREEAQPYFDKLYQVGILHYEAKSLAKKIEEIYHNPMDWWMQNEVQQAKDEFCKQFAHIGGNALKKWKKEINRIANET
jgi:putative transferase (TIGR04331 family)